MGPAEGWELEGRSSRKADAECPSPDEQEEEEKEEKKEEEDDEEEEELKVSWTCLL